MNRASLLTESRRGAGSTLKKSELVQLVSRLHDCNHTLSFLVEHALALEFGVGAQRCLRLAEFFRTPLQALHKAFCRTLICDGFDLYYVGIEVMPRDAALFQVHEEEPVKSFEIGVAIRGYDLDSPQRWQRLCVDFIGNDGNLPRPYAVSVPGRTHAEFPRIAALNPQSKALDSSSTVQGRPHSFTSAYICPSPLTRTSEITDLCHSFQEANGKNTHSECYGYISTELGHFYLYSGHPHPDETSVVTLGKILDGHDAGMKSIQFGIDKRLGLALALAYGILHLYRTPWLGRTIALDDVIFLGEKHSSGGYNFRLNRPHLAQSLPRSSGKSQAAQAESSPMNLKIISLGLVLTQIIIARRVPDLAIDPLEDWKSINERLTVASGMAQEADEASSNYFDAVQWCLDQHQEGSISDNRDFELEFGEHVILKLENDSRTIRGLNLVSQHLPESDSGDVSGSTIMRLASESKDAEQSDSLPAQLAHKSHQEDDAEMQHTSELESVSVSESRFCSLNSTIPSSLSTGFTSMDSEHLGSLAAQLAQASQQDDDVKTQYTTEEALPLEKVDAFTSDLGDTIYTNICGSYSQATGKPVDVSWAERLHAVLPEVLRSFAIRLGNDVHAHDSSRKEKILEAVRFIHSHRQ